MEPIKFIKSKTAVLAGANIDTDQILPARYLTTTTKVGLGKALFAEWRYNSDGTLNQAFVLNTPQFADATILVVGKNFGAGSSREHAPWALLDFGIRAVVSTEIADIFKANCLKNGLLPVIVEAPVAAWLVGNPGAEIEINLETSKVTLPDGTQEPFKIDAFARHLLLNGIDDLTYLLDQLPALQAYEKLHGK